jgi:O-antigen ligase
MTLPFRLRVRAGGLVPVAVGGWAAAIATAPDIATKVALAAPAPIVAGAWWTLLEPSRWIHVLFFCLILLPPLPIDVGNSGAHVAPLIVAAGIVGGFLRSSEWKPRGGALSGLMLLFPAVALASTALAALYSGAQVAAGSLARVFLLSIGVYVFLYASIGPQRHGFDPFIPARWLYRFALAGALFACIDFYFQLPAPSGFGAQYVWVDSGVFRRAQGLFYEASTLGNFCAFFLVMTIVAAFRFRDDRPLSRLSLAAGLVLFPGALIFSYSRASALNLVVAGVAYLYIRGVPARRLVVVSGVVAAAALAILRFALPRFFSHYTSRVAATFEGIQEAPNLALSGRVATWQAIGEFLSAHPWSAILGIGYKTLPYSHYTGAGLVADNTYLSLLVETGIVGLIIFLMLNWAILRTALRAARSPQHRASFFGTWIFCFWCGEVVQMLSGDLITYWRVLPVYFWVLATADREAAE